MDPVERLAADVQQLKSRFDEMSLRFAVSEEREKRVDDKIDNMALSVEQKMTNMAASVEQKMNSAVATIAFEVNGIKGSIEDKKFFRRAVIIGAVGVITATLIRWVMAGNLAGVL